MTTQVFVVGTGRSGTATLAHLLSAAPGCRVVHEHEPKLLSELRDFLAGRLSHPEMADLLCRTRSTAAIGGGRLSGEANQRLSLVLPALAEAFPAARLVWVVRDGRAAVASMYHRKWYHPREAAERPAAVRPWAVHRLQGDEVGDLSPSAWARLDAFGRCCWYWAHVMQVVARDAARTGLPTLVLRIEDLEARRHELAAFLGLSPEALPTGARRMNRATGGRPLAWRTWSPRQRATFQAFCAQAMSQHYPSWEADMRPTVGDAAYGLVARAVRATSIALASRTRPLRVRLGLVRSGPPLALREMR
jgi:hypothetical protein